MPAIIQPKITDAGLAAAINEDNDGFQLAITHVALGTGVYDSNATGEGMTDMVGMQEFVQIDAGVVSGTGGCRIMVLFEAWEGVPSTYDVTEVGFWAGEPGAPGSVLFAIYSHPTEVIVERNSLDYIASYTIQLTRVPPGSVTVEIDPSGAQALALIALHEAASDPHVQYVKKTGDTSTGPQMGLTASQHDSSTIFATTAFVKRTGLTFPAQGGLAITTTPFNLTAAHMGRWANVQVAAAINLPSAAAVPVGGSYCLRVPASGATLFATGGDVIASPNGDITTSLFLSRGETVVVTANSAGYWFVTSAGSRLPAGQVSYFAGNSAPPGWLKLNGALLSRAAYAELWAYAQSTGGLVTDAEWMASSFFGRFSSGTDGSNFRIPDARGLFLRSFDDGRGVDAGRNWGTFQDHANRLHNHIAIADSQGSHVHTGGTSTNGAHRHDSGFGESSAEHTRYGVTDGVQNKFGSKGSFDFDNYAYWTSTDGDHSHLFTTAASGSHSHNISVGNDGSEARPKNLAWSLFVKF